MEVVERLTTNDIRISLSNRTDDFSVTQRVPGSELSTNSTGRATCLDDGFTTWDIQRHHGGCAKYLRYEQL